MGVQLTLATHTLTHFPLLNEVAVVEFERTIRKTMYSYMRIYTNLTEHTIDAVSCRMEGYP